MTILSLDYDSFFPWFLKQLQHVHSGSENPVRERETMSVEGLDKMQY